MELSGTVLPTCARQTPAPFRESDYVTNFVITVMMLIFGVI